MSGDRSEPVLVVLAAGRARRFGGVKPLAPVGPAGEPVLDLLASDALAAGFGSLVLVLGSATGPAVRYHVERTWPTPIEVHFAEQLAPIGTVDAVLAASSHLRDGEAFGVANADDIYGRAALSLLAQRLRSHPADNALVSFRLRNAVIGDKPVTRGVCALDDHGTLVSIEERRNVVASGPGSFAAGDGLQPAALDGDVLVSMNLWGFAAAMRDVFSGAMKSASEASEDAEVLLPEVVGALLGDPSAGRLGQFTVIPTEDRCIGVTHPGDLALVQADLAGQIGRGERPGELWPSVK